ncbi:nuclear transport factor 2 family protein [Paucibacter sp. TC2R-5]|uniref:nuclear transport factor 2 family protein n=1 Tax=Paucibacter sp. TC2R-5 TaxID=2893555 RepID=UPI0021E40982|nr:nuclear transport factor 2 family protein [Paucibacter sp. TC2R-5]MCV2360031.1 nuclear transport factor 2 family protein [Paucibacter sp. TC2R-5]
MNPEYFAKLEKERTRAIVARDMATVEAMHAPEYELVTPAGRVLPRERYLELIAEAPFYSAWEHGAMQVRVSPGMAAVKYQAKLAFPEGKVLECWHTDIYELRGSLWQAVWSQATQLPGSERNAG